MEIVSHFFTFILGLIVLLKKNKQEQIRIKKKYNNKYRQIINKEEITKEKDKKKE